MPSGAPSSPNRTTSNLQVPNERRSSRRSTTSPMIQTARIPSGGFIAGLVYTHVAALA